jgi:hypothetical protein
VAARLAPASPDCRPAGSVRTWRACLVLASCWALTGAGLAGRVFQSWSTHPALVFNPRADGPIPADFNDSELGTLILAALMAVVLACLWAWATATGFGYLRSARLPGRWRTAWTCAVAAAAAVSEAFLGVFVDPLPLLGQMEHGWQQVYGHPNWGLLVLSACT